jgi:hypothetical protein
MSCELAVRESLNAVRAVDTDRELDGGVTGPPDGRVWDVAVVLPFDPYVQVAPASPSVVTLIGGQSLPVPDGTRHVVLVVRDVRLHQGLVPVVVLAVVPLAHNVGTRLPPFVAGVDLTSHPPDPEGRQSVLDGDRVVLAPVVGVVDGGRGLLGFQPGADGRDGCGGGDLDGNVGPRDVDGEQILCSAQHDLIDQLLVVPRRLSGHPVLLLLDSSQVCWSRSSRTELCLGRRASRRSKEDAGEEGHDGQQRGEALSSHLVTPFGLCSDRAASGSPYTNALNLADGSVAAYVNARSFLL